METTHSTSTGEVLPATDDTGRKTTEAAPLTFEQRTIETLLSFERQRLDLARTATYTQHKKIEARAAREGRVFRVLEEFLQGVFAALASPGVGPRAQSPAEAPGQEAGPHPTSDVLYIVTPPARRAAKSRSPKG